jgi:hypothetical protein
MMGKKNFESYIADHSVVSNQRRTRQFPFPSGKNHSNSSSRNKMMSNPTSVLQQRQKLHRRQNSTPVAFEALKVPILSPAIQRHNSHRRGQSLDQRNPTRGANRQSGSTVSITNQGSTNIGQHILREAQQQNLAGPGQRNQLPISPRCGTFADPNIDQNELFTSATIDAMLQEQAMMHVASPLQQYFSQDLYMPASAGLESMGSNVDENSQHYFHPTHQMTLSMEDEMLNERRMSQPDLQMYAQQRPITPAQQMNSGKCADEQFGESRLTEQKPIFLSHRPQLRSTRPIASITFHGRLNRPRSEDMQARTSSHPIRS